MHCVAWVSLKVFARWHHIIHLLSCVICYLATILYEIPTKQAIFIVSSLNVRWRWWGKTPSHLFCQLCLSSVTNRFNLPTFFLSAKQCLQKNFVQCRYQQWCCLCSSHPKFCPLSLGVLPRHEKEGGMMSKFFYFFNNCLMYQTIFVYNWRSIMHCFIAMFAYTIIRI